MIKKPTAFIKLVIYIPNRQEYIQSIVSVHVKQAMLYH